MSEPLLDQLDDLIGGSAALGADAFQEVVTSPGGQTAALVVVLLAGLSLGIGQSIILFVNRVPPVRFLFSLVLNAILFVFGFLFLVFSTWLIGWFPGLVRAPWYELVNALGLSYAPMLFSFLGAMPYAGVPILSFLSVWHLLAMVAGFAAITQVSWPSAFVHVALGWVMLNILQNTVGQPIARLGQRLTRKVAGTDLVVRRSELRTVVQSGLPASQRESAAPVAAPVDSPIQWPTPSQPVAVSVDQTAALRMPVAEAETLEVQFSHWSQRIPQAVRLGAMLLGMIVLFVLVAVLLRPVREYLFGWYENLPWLIRRIFDLIWISIVAIIFAGLLAPLETLGWWAGWYGDDLDTTAPAPAAETTASAAGRAGQPTRYVVYVDGVGQSGEAHTPDVVEFNEALESVLPPDVEFIHGLMMYSVLNQPLNQNRPLAWLWRLADKMRWQNPMALLGLMVNVRNAWIVALSADQRYGPIYNQGIAQTLYNGLIQRGYVPDSGTPITLVGYSGGAQMSVAAAPYLKKSLSSPIDVVSLGGVMSANNQFLILEHLYHLVGDKDSVAGLGPVLFPGRRKWMPLSFWNRAMRKGKISEISLGPMGHQVPGGMMDPNAFLPDGESHLQHTIQTILSILTGKLLVASRQRSRQLGHYELYKQAEFNHYTYYPLRQTVDPQWYRPIADWMGRLILPQQEERPWVRGVWFEVHHAAPGYESLVGQQVVLRWADNPLVQEMVRAVTRDVHFSIDAEYASQYGGSIHPTRLNHWRQVDPLESLAGAHPVNDLIVLLTGEVQVESADGQTVLRIAHQPVEVTGRYYGLVRFEAAVPGTDRFQVRHFNPASRHFDGLMETVRLPQVVQAKTYGSYPSTTNQLEQSPLNELGWYIYGAKDAAGYFVVQSLGPRSLFRLQPERVVFGGQPSYRYIRRESWADAVAQKGRIASVLGAGQRDIDIQTAIDQWQVGDRVLLLHVYGGIGGNNKEPAAATPIFFGHFAYGLATVILDPLSQERRFEIQYYQVYCHNIDGLTAGTIHWSRYMGDRQFGWMGSRPVCDILIKFDPFTGHYNIHDRQYSPLDRMLTQLEAMTARYRIGDGTGGTFVGAANNCAQDSNQALFASIRSINEAIATNQAAVDAWLAQHPAEAKRYEQLSQVKTNLNRRLRIFGAPRRDWDANQFSLGSTLEDDPLRNLRMGLGSWRSLLPRKASDTVVQVFLEQGASVWVLRTNQVGGHDPNIEPIAPMTI